MPTATAGGWLEADSVLLLSDRVKSMLAKVVAYLMTPAPAGKGLVGMDEVIHHLEKSLEKACSEIYYIYKIAESDQSHVIVNGMRYSELFDEAHLFSKAIGPRSPEYALLYETKKSQLAGIRETVEKLVDEFISTTDFVNAGDSAMVGCLLIDVWKAVTANKALEENDIVRLIIGVLRGAGYYKDGDFESLEKLIRDWCDTGAYGRDDSRASHSIASMSRVRWGYGRDDMRSSD